MTSRLGVSAEGSGRAFASGKRAENKLDGGGPLIDVSSAKGWLGRQPLWTNQQPEGGDVPPRREVRLSGARL